MPQNTGGTRELLPCPFCGASGDSLVTYHEVGTVLHPWYRIECDHCGAKGPGTDRGTHREDWNTRHFGRTLTNEIGASPAEPAAEEDGPPIDTSGA